MTSFWDEWFRRFGISPGVFPSIDDMFEEMEREMAEIFRQMENQMPEDMMREHRLPDGSTRRKYGPFVYGYSVRIGPDGRPVVREFGNMKPGTGEEGPPLDLRERREPLVDVVEDEDGDGDGGGGSIKVVAELPGVDKGDIQLYATDEALTIKVEKPGRNYYKRVELPAHVEEESARSIYRNGVLETTLKKKAKEKSRGKRIDIE